MQDVAGLVRRRDFERQGLDDLAAISSGVTGRCGDIDGVWIAPVTAQVMMTLRACAAMMESRDWQALQVLDVAVDADCLAADVARGR